MNGLRVWLARRIFPLLATVVLVAVTMASSMWWGPHLVGKPAWQLPDDLWGTLVAARRLLHLDPGGLYTAPTGLVSLPGAAVILTPIVAVIDAARMGLAVPGVHNAHPAAWLVAGPSEVVLSATALFAGDATAERLGVSRPKRALLAAAGAIALWSVSARWGHPEDALAVALLLYGILALTGSRVEHSAWFVGAAVAVQPLVLLAMPVLLVVVEPRRLAGYLTRAAAPATLLLGFALAANWSATLSAVANQPNWPAVDHPTPWTSLAPHMGHGAIAAGPARGIAILLACGCAVVLERRWRAARCLVEWSPLALEELLWWVGVTLSLRCVFESVMNAYYVWPTLAVAMSAATRHWSRLVPTAVAASALTFLLQASWHGRWTWWGAMVGGLVLTLAVARGAPGRSTPRWGTSALETPRPLAVTSSQGSHDTRLRSST
ncbi:MAG TPA: hypothetical protein VMV22_02610 [Acidimicrobiales bacterium]|nr:hypothetical protein [Acidimicrobiales bacterium]